MELITGHPDWYGWKSDGGTWWATRRGCAPLTEGQYDRGMETTVSADDWDGLMAKLARQDAIATPAR